MTQNYPHAKYLVTRINPIDEHIWRANSHWNYESLRDYDHIPLRVTLSMDIGTGDILVAAFHRPTFTWATIATLPKDTILNRSYGHDEEALFTRHARAAATFLELRAYRIVIGGPVIDPEGYPVLPIDRDRIKA